MRGLNPVLRIFAAALLVCALILNSALAQPVQNSENDISAKYDHKLAEKLEKLANASKNEKIPVIISLKKSNTPGKIHSQSFVATSVEVKGGKVKYKYNLINAIAAYLPAERIPELAKLNVIERIYYDERCQIFPGQFVTTSTTELSDATQSIGADYAWNMGYDGTGVVVAVLDTGINYTHPDLGGGFGPGYKVAGGYDFVNDDDDPMDDNDKGHGTHVAGIIAANGTIKGVAPNATLLAVKVLGADGSGNISDIIAGIDWSVRNGADIISMSLGGFAFPNDGNHPLSLAVDAAVDRGVVVVVAAGNDGPGTGTISSPADAKGVITVGAVDTNGTATISDDVIASFSNRGPSAFGRLDPDVVAPGVAINSTSIDGGYMVLSGTSMAAPFVSGAVALLLQKDPSLTPEQVRAILMRTASDIGSHVFEQGAGFINITNALTYNISASINGNDRWEISVMPGLSTSATLTLSNANDYEVNFTFTLEPITDLEKDKSLPESCFSLPDYIVVPPNSNRSIEITITAPNDAKPAIYGTTLIISGENTGTLRIPIVITIPLLENGTIYGSVDDGPVWYWYEGDWVYYKVKAYNGTSLYAKLEWSSSTNDLDLYLLAPNGVLVNLSENRAGTYEEVSLSDMVYDEYWLVVHAYSLNNEENYTITVSYPASSLGSIQVSPASWQGTVKREELKNITFTITNDDVPKTLNLSVNILSPGSNDFLSGTVGNTGGDYLIVWNVSSSGIDITNARYVNVTLEWDNSSNDLDLALFYWNGSAWVKTRFYSEHDNVQLGEAIEKLENVDVQYYLKTYPDFGIGILNWGTSQTFNLTVNFTSALPWNAASVNVTALSLGANDVKQVSISINGSKLVPGIEYDALFIASNGSRNFATIPLFVSLYTPVRNIDTGRVYPTIQEAINDYETLNGHTIVVEPGEYAENLILNKTVTIIGNGPSDSVVIKAKDPFQPAIRIENVTNAAISNLTVRDAAVGIYIFNTSYLDVSHINATNNSRGISVIDSDKITLDSVIATNNIEYGVLLSGATNSTVSKCEISSSEIAGIYVENSQNNTILNSSIYYNEFGIYLNNSSSISIADSYLKENMWDFVSESGVNNEILNTVFNTTRASLTYDGDVRINSTISPPSNPIGYGDIGKFIRIENISVDAWVFLNISYSDEDLINAGLQESTLKIWKYNGTAWVEDGWNGTRVLDTVNNVVGVNITSFSIFAPLALDVTPPAITIYSPENRAYNTSSIMLNYSVTDNIAVNSVWYILSYENGSIIDSNVTDTYFTKTVSLSDGNYNLTVYANDTAGNMRSSSVVFTIDTIPPVITFVDPTPQDGSSVDVNYVYINITSSEPLSLAILEWNDGTTLLNYTMSGSETNWYYKVTSLPNGEYSYRIYAKDTAGNWNVSETRSVTVNVPAPQTTAPSGGGGGGGGGALPPPVAPQEITSVSVTAPTTATAGSFLNISVSFTANFYTAQDVTITAIVPAGWNSTSIELSGVTSGGSGVITVTVPENVTAGNYTITLRIVTPFGVEEKQITIQVEEAEQTPVITPTPIETPTALPTETPAVEETPTPTATTTPNTTVEPKAEPETPAKPRSIIPGFEAVLVILSLVATAFVGKIRRM